MGWGEEGEGVVRKDRGKVGLVTGKLCCDGNTQCF